MSARRGLTERPDLSGYLQNDSITFDTAWDGAHCTCTLTPRNSRGRLQITSPRVRYVSPLSNL